MATIVMISSLHLRCALDSLGSKVVGFSCTLGLGSWQKYMTGRPLRKFFLVFFFC